MLKLENIIGWTLSTTEFKSTWRPFFIMNLKSHKNETFVWTKRIISSITEPDGTRWT